VKNTFLIVAVTAVPKLMLGAPIVNCADLAKNNFGAEVKIESSTLGPAMAKQPECDVRGTIWPEAKFALKLPAVWNGRFQMVGNGGTAGVLSLAAVDAGVRKGYATVSNRHWTRCG
jgi:hypothetical protein